MVRIIFLLLFLFIANTGFSEPLDFSIRQNFMSARALGMGNAYIAMADDYNTLLINPAGLARLETWQLNMSLEGAAGLDFQNFVGSLSASQGDNSTTGLTTLLTKFQGNAFHFRAVPAQGFLVRPGFGMALVPVDVTADLAIRKRGITPSLDVTIYADTTAAMGFARDARVGNGRFSWGVTGKLIHRVQMAKSMDPLDLLNSNNKIFSEDDANEGLTADADVGILWTPKLPHYGMWKVFKLARPTFGAVVRNTIGTGFFQNFHMISSKTGKPLSLKRTVDLGSRWEYPKLWIFRSRGLMDIRDIGDPNWTFYKGIHIGWELAWKMYDWWKGYYRFGLNQGYLTFGVSARLGIWNFDLATWGEEVGQFSSRKESRRVMVKLNIEI